MKSDVVKWAMYDAPMLFTDKGKPDFTARFVLVVLAEAAHADGTGSYPSVERICLATGFTPPTVTSALRRLMAAGLIAEDGAVGKHTQWKLAVSVKRAESERKELSAAQAERRRVEAAKRRARRHRAKRPTSTESMSGGSTPGHEAGDDDDVRGSDPRTSGAADGGLEAQMSGVQTPGRPGVEGADIRGFDPRTPRLHCLKGTTQGSTPEVGGAFARPQTPRETDLGSTYVGGSSNAQLDLESCVPHAHEPARTHEASRWSMWGAAALIAELTRRWDIEYANPGTDTANAAVIRALQRELERRGVDQEAQDSGRDPQPDAHDLTRASATERLRPRGKSRHLRVIRGAS